MYICTQDFTITDADGTIDALDITHVATQADGTVLFSIAFLERGEIKIRLYSSNELRFTRKDCTNE